MNKKQNTDTSVRVRFAPSPTGYLHIGNFRTALFNWLFARHNKGTFLIRVEDTDLERSKPEYTQAVLRSLAWAGIDYDEEIVIQSERIDEHKRVMQKLIDEGKAYRCYCSSDDVTARYKARGIDDLFIKYDKHCRNTFFSDVDIQGKPFVIRFAIPENITEVSFDDIIRGRVTFPIEQFDDFIVARSDGSPMYNFVVVIDDAFMGITHVIRGEDHISNTPKQILLFKACGYDVPHFAHLPLILGPSGDRLSKRDAATAVLEYRQEGFLPDAFINYLVRLGWSHGDQEIFTRKELIDLFSLDQIGKKGSVFDSEKLRWVNGVYIRERDAKDLYAYILEHVNPEFATTIGDWSADQVMSAINLYKERVHTLAELVSEISLFYNGPDQYNADDMQKWITQEAASHINALITSINQLEQVTADTITASVKAIAKELGVKLVALAQPIRIALVGKSSGPGVFDLVEILGKQQTLGRLHALLDKIK
jgi:glutamyl-tRNA synthetase